MPVMMPALSLVMMATPVACYLKSLFFLPFFLLCLLAGDFPAGTGAVVNGAG